MGFLSKHREVIGGLAIGLLAAAYQIAIEPSVSAGYVVGVLVGSLLIYGTIGGFAIWLFSPKRKKDSNA
jgi:hypothetical protein